MGCAQRMPPLAGGAVLFHLALREGKGMAEKAAQRAAGAGISGSGSVQTAGIFLIRIYGEIYNG